MAYLKNLKNRESLAYRFTIIDKTDKELVHLKQLVKQQNKVARKYPRYNKVMRVRLMARGGARDTGTYCTPHVNATHFDVYVY